MSDQAKRGDESGVFELANGDVRVWIEQENIHLAAFDRKHHDPVELTARMARTLAAKLEDMAKQIDD